VDAGGEVARPQEREIVGKFGGFGKSKWKVEVRVRLAEFLTAESAEGAEGAEGDGNLKF
jgi:hypothetical protein